MMAYSVSRPPLEIQAGRLPLRPSGFCAMLLTFNRQIRQAATLCGVLEIVTDILLQALDPAILVIALRPDRVETEVPVSTLIGQISPDLLSQLDSRWSFTPGLQTVSGINDNGSKSVLRRAGIHLVTPLFFNNDTVGWLGLGLPRCNRYYTQGELHFLEMVVSQTALILRNQYLHTNLNHSVAQLRRAYQQIIQAQEYERRQLAETLHDETLQHLADISVRLGLLRRKSAACPTTISDIQTRLAKTDRSLREFVRGIHPAVLSDLGLVEAIIAFLESLRAPTNGFLPQVEFTVVGFKDARLPDESLELALYRFIQNATANALKHGAPECLSIVLCWETAWVKAIIEDDGCGTTTSVEEAARAGHFGLLTMRERIEAFQGHFSFCSTPGKGTKVAGCVPGTMVSPAPACREHFVFAGC
ncbi:MAG: hypothetical protein KDJ52_27890 [Anaerolineae bacterium]|nr:hypothetical protein [Anaerolineae bacterium]